MQDLMRAIFNARRPYLEALSQIAGEKVVRDRFAAQHVPWVLRKPRTARTARR